MIKSLEEKMRGLIDAYLRAKQIDEMEEEIDFCNRMKNNRAWLKENILNLEKLKSYDNAEFAKKFGEMFDRTNGSASANARARGMHFSTNENRLAVRNQFENMIGYIISHASNRFDILAEVTDKSGAYKVHGIGPHMASALINAEYPDVPIDNNDTKDFFRNIGEPLPKDTSIRQREVGKFFADMLALNNELTLDDIDHICWYSKTIPSGCEYMMSNFPSTFVNENNSRRSATGRRRAKKLTKEEQLAARIAELQAIQDSSNY